MLGGRATPTAWNSLPAPPVTVTNARSERPRPMWQAKPGYLFHPIFDFLLGGGGSIICFVLFQRLIGDYNKDSVGPKVLAFTVTLSIFVNYPHFAHSYQMLYAGFARRVLGPATDRLTRLRYIWAGLVVPVLLAAFFVYAAQQSDSRIMSYAWNGMFFFVGWHYVKQGLYVIPAFHSLQYLLFVWRFQINKAQASAARPPRLRRLRLSTQLQGVAAFAGFMLLGETLGWFGFLGLPHTLDLAVAYDRGVWGAGLFLFMIFMFINIHHYFIDNVIWRKENDEVRQYLFAT
jgi:hypothetical protein